MNPTDRGLFAGLLTFAIVVPLTILYALLVSDYMGLLMFDGGDAALGAKLSLAGIGLALLFVPPVLVALVVRNAAVAREPYFPEKPLTEADIVLFRSVRSGE